MHAVVDTMGRGSPYSYLKWGCPDESDHVSRERLDRGHRRRGKIPVAYLRDVDRGGLTI